MFAIDHPTASPTLPAPTAAGTPGFWINANSATDIGTYVDATWLNAVQGELLNVLTAAGVSPVKAASGAVVANQVIQSIRRLAGGNVTSVTTGGALTPDMAGILEVNAVSGAISVSLPASASAGNAPLSFLFVRLDESSNAVTVTIASGDAIIPGSATTLGVGPGEVVRVTGDGVTNWTVQRTRRLAQAFTASGTLQIPAGYTQAHIIAVGGGGGGANCSSGGGNNVSGAGGGGGGYAEGLYAVTPGASYAVTVGSGGAAQAAGTASSVASFLTANGGGGGAFQSAQSSAGAAGGSASGGNIVNIQGQIGGDGMNGGLIFAGYGGSAPRGWGGGGRAGAHGGVAGTGYGGGGGGAYDSQATGTNYPGGAGAPGIVYVELLP